MKFLRRNLSLMLAVRYLNPLRTLFSIITLICLLGVALGVMVLIVVLGVMEGLQDEMESRSLAFTPHFVVSLSDGMQTVALTENGTHWPELQDKIAKIPGVVCVYPQVQAHVLAQSNAGRQTAAFTAVDPKNQSQIQPLAEMLRFGSFDFGEGLDQQCVVSANLAGSLDLSVGEKLHVVPVGSLDKITPLLSMVLSPMQTRADGSFIPAAQGVFDGAVAVDGGVLPVAEKLEGVMEHISQFDIAKLRPGENELLDVLYDLGESHRGGKIPFTPQEQKRWLDSVQQLVELDHDKEDGRALKSMRDMVLPMDLEIIGVYQAPENMPGPDLYIPLPIAQEMVGYGTSGGNEVMALCVRVESEKLHQLAPIEAQIRSLLPQVQSSEQEHPLGLQWEIIPWSESFKQWHQMIAKERIMMSFVLSSISLIASFCIMAVMFTVSLQRRREIAVLQALGATPARIMAIFTWQGVIIGFVGALLGVALALLVLYYRLEIQAFLASMDMDPFPMQTHGITLPAKYTPSTIIMQAVRAFIMVILASAIPAFFISRQDPAKALRSN